MRLVLLTLLAPLVVTACRSRASGVVTRSTEVAGPGGRAILSEMHDLVRDAREAVIRRELQAGHIPAFLWTVRAVSDTATASDGRRHVIEYEVMPDYLALGHQSDFVRMPMTPATAQVFLDAHDMVLPTRRMVNAIWRAAEERLAPQPLTEAREATATFAQHHDLIERQRQRAASRTFVAGIKKDVVQSVRLRERPDRVAIYGWHRLDGTPIQPLYLGHVDWYVDYSHGVRPVRRRMRVDGRTMRFEEIARHPVLHVLVSDEGPLPP